MGEPAASESRRFEFDYTPEFVEQLEKAPQFYRALLRVLKGIERYPFPGEALLGVRPYKEDDLPGGYTAIVRADEDEAFLVFQVMTNIDVIKLVELIWT